MNDLDKNEILVTNLILLEVTKNRYLSRILLGEPISKSIVVANVFISGFEFA